MSAKTRFFAICSLLVLVVGVGTGLVAYYLAGPGARARADGLDELQYVPRDAALIAFADLRDLMTSDFRRRLHDSVPASDAGPRAFQSRTGINVETDIDRVVAYAGVVDPSGKRTLGIVLARGRFDQMKIEALMREHGAQVEDYHGTRLISADGAPGSQPERFAAAFLETGLVAFGNAESVRTAIDLPRTGEDATSNEDLMKMIRSLDPGNAWAVGRVEAFQAAPGLPDAVKQQLPAIKWFSISGRVGDGIRGVVRVETRDEEAAENLRDVLRGFVALGKLQAEAKPGWQQALSAVELGGSGTIVAMSFAFPSDTLDALQGRFGSSPPTR